jgi:hypothetical protein
MEAQEAREASPLSLSSTPPTPSGALTPKEVREERWRADADNKPGKLEMRAMYKEYAGRKVRGKGRLVLGVGGGGSRDRGGWEEDTGEEW